MNQPKHDIQADFWSEADGPIVSIEFTITDLEKLVHLTPFECHDYLKKMLAHIAVENEKHGVAYENNEQCEEKITS